MNRKDGGFLLVDVESEWFYPESDSTDAAVIPLAIREATKYVDYKFIPQKMLATASVITDQDIGIGDDLLIVGLFSQREGTRKNLPVVRKGTLSSMPEEPLQDSRTGKSYHAYLAEVRSIGGLSGSPVFVVLEPGRVKEDVIVLERKVFLLGLVRGHWDFARSYESPESRELERETLNMGMAIVTPIGEASAIVQSAEFQQCITSHK